ncbi:MAG TPA: metallophosphoesterase family protein [Symbiobacteriaceae bacterium]|nr:metallophosphoesterase family protein [Symbiobacteriaceae bacterium]
MRIGILSDIHGNLPALQAVQRELERHQVDQIVNLGDVAFRGPAPRECWEAVRAMGAPVLRGNTEDWLTGAAAIPAPLAPIRDWTLARLDDGMLAEMGALPFDHRIEAYGKRIRFVHGSPQSNMEFIFPFTPEEELTRAVVGAEAEILVMGHTHWTFSRRIAGVHLIGVGSIGLPFDGDPGAAFAVLEVTADAVRLTHLRVSYDGERTLSMAQESGFPDGEFLASAVKYGRRPE